MRTLGPLAASDVEGDDADNERGAEEGYDGAADETPGSVVPTR